MKRVAGLLIFLIAVGIGAVREFGVPGSALLGGTTELTGYVGSEKIAFLANPQVQELLRERYRVLLVPRSAGSLEMMELPMEEIDFLWPSSDIALERFRELNGPPLASATVFNSPIVLYSWPEITDVLASARLVTSEETILRAPLEPLIELMNARRTWSDIGVPGVFGPFTIISTDPLRSNSGLMYMGLVASALSGMVVDTPSLARVEPDLLTAFRVQGPMEHSTGTLFSRYLQRGVAEYPFIVGYESQYIELPPAERKAISIIYPIPTVWSSHPVIATTEAGEALIEALQDPDILDIAWREHGFRGPDGQNDPGELDLTRVPRTVTNVIRTPRPTVVFEMLRSLEQIQ